MSANYVALPASFLPPPGLSVGITASPSTTTRTPPPRPVSGSPGLLASTEKGVGRPLTALRKLNNLHHRSQEFKICSAWPRVSPRRARSVHYERLGLCSAGVTHNVWEFIVLAGEKKASWRLKFSCVGFSHAPRVDCVPLLLRMAAQITALFRNTPPWASARFTTVSDW
ncbi:hypothetical protein E2C01_055613 [Portunus trituberculatus]|uniref:Uncharacterized protein n=1 Tax=Portunus trituberculatus TaxID=210409 RepID=A0A5B7GMY4_PORTR|nr:hypothetical protein [Portunus trituberculatus]